MGSPKLILAAAIFSSLSAPLALGADLDTLPPDQAPIDQPVELGTGWYLRGDAGWTRDSGLSFIPTNGTRNGYLADIGIGYQFNPWFRADATLEGRNFSRANGTGPLQNTNATACQTGFTYTKDANGNYTSSSPSYEACADHYKNKIQNSTLMLNGYVDLGTWSSITPYIGAGIGTSRIRQSGTNRWFASNGVDVYDFTASNLFTGGGPYHFFRDTTYRKTSYNLAWALMAGAAIDVTSHVKLDLGYRYASFGNYRVSDVQTGAIYSKKLTAQEFRAGLRYMID